MNNLLLIENWELAADIYTKERRVYGDLYNGEKFIRTLNEKVNVVDFKNKLIETDNGYYALGGEKL